MKNALIWVLVVLVIAILSVGAFFIYGGGNGYMNPGTNGGGTPNGATSNIVNIQNFAFSPATLTVAKGTTVTWINNDSVNHQIKSDTFNSAPLLTGQNYSFTFDNAGTFNYSCAIHPSMTGKIIVK